jgi:hypothetical protein
MEHHDRTRMPIHRFEVFGMFAYIAGAGFMLVIAVASLRNPTSSWLPRGPAAFHWSVLVFAVVTIPIAVWKLVHSATSIRITEDSIDVGIAFFFHRSIPSQNVLSVRCKKSKYNEPDCRVTYTGGYFDVFLPQDERWEDLTTHLMELV